MIYPLKQGICCIIFEHSNSLGEPGKVDVAVNIHPIKY